ncbi:hypothetical protein QWY90_01355 [Flavobacterium paronense]|nr:hypothetical protein [Flavobacterium paronense]MDN3675957.1 hypothetical protein [Flavobacterium paronense]
MKKRCTTALEFRFLNNPERFDADGTLTLRVSRLANRMRKVVRRPVETNETVTLLVDSLITAIGEQQDTGSPECDGRAAGQKRLARPSTIMAKLV